MWILGPYRKVYETLREHFLEKSYRTEEAEALAQYCVSQPLPTSIKSIGATKFWLEQNIGRAAVMLEDEWFALSNKIQDAALTNPVLCTDGAYVEAVYPGMCLVKESDGRYAAADWMLEEDGTVSFSSVRHVTSKVDWIVNEQMVNLTTAINLVEHWRRLPLQAELELLTRAVVGNGMRVYATPLDGVRPMEEKNLRLFMQEVGALTESYTPETELPAVDARYSGQPEQAMIRINVVFDELRILEGLAIANRVNLARTTIGIPMQMSDLTEKTVKQIHALVFDETKFTPEQAKRWAKLHGFKYEQEANESHRFVQFEATGCKPESYKTFDLFPGVKGILCAKVNDVTEAIDEAKRRKRRAAGIIRRTLGPDQMTVGEQVIMLTPYLMTEVMMHGHNVDATEYDGPLNQIARHKKMQAHLADRGFKKDRNATTFHGEIHSGTVDGVKHKVELKGGRAHVYTPDDSGAMTKIGTASYPEELAQCLNQSAEVAQ